jgi:hypothetical protein
VCDDDVLKSGEDRGEDFIEMFLPRILMRK